MLRVQINITIITAITLRLGQKYLEELKKAE
jgi:hypothetical protein